MSRSMALLGLLLALGIMPAAAQRVDQAKTLADSGFRPKPHGFSFANWGGNQHPHAKLTAEDAAIMFGDQVCARRTNGLCVPTPGAKMWIDKMNKSSEGGHCEGMAVLSAAFYAKAESPQTLGAKEAFALAPKSEVLMRSISAYFAMQFLEPVSSASKSALKLTLQQLVDRLIESIKAGKDYPTVGFYYSDGGHAVTPYRVDSTGPGLYRVYIYDNNYPGAEKYIDFDIPRDQWTYLGAALNPAEAASAWKGGTGTFEVTMLSARYQPLKCPFCTGPSAPKPAAKPTPAKPQPGATKPTAKPTPAKPQPGAQTPKAPTPGAQRPKAPNKPQPRKPAVAKPKTPAPAAARPAPRPAAAQNRQPAMPADSYMIITPSRCTQVQAVAKGSKQQVRMGAGGIDNQIEGATMQRIRGARGCVVSLPKDQEYDVRLVDDGLPSTRPSTDLIVFAPGKVYEVSDVVIRPNVTESFSVAPDNFSYQAGGSQKPTLRVGGAGEGSNGYYEVSGFELSEGREFGARDTDEGKIAFSNNDPGIDRFDLRAEIVDEEDSAEYEFEDFEVGDNGQALIDIDEEGDLYVDVDSDSDGDYDAIDEDDDNDGEMDEADDDDDNDGVSDADDDAYYLDDDADDDSETGEDESDLGDDESDFGDDEAEDLADGDDDDGDGLDEDEGDDDGSEKSIAGGSEEDEGDEDEDEADYESDEGDDDEADYESDEGDEDEADYESDEGGEDEADYESDEGDEDEADYESDEGDEDEADYESDEGDEDEADYESDEGGEDEADYDSDEGDEDEADYESDEGGEDEGDYESDEGGEDE